MKVNKDEYSASPWSQEDYNLVGYIKHIYNVTMIYTIYLRSKEQFKALGKLGSFVSTLILILQKRKSRYRFKELSID